MQIQAAEQLLQDALKRFNNDFENEKTHKTDINHINHIKMN